jgi:hypothetical protein
VQPLPVFEYTPRSIRRTRVLCIGIVERRAYGSNRRPAQVGSYCPAEATFVNTFIVGKYDCGGEDFLLLDEFAHSIRDSAAILVRNCANVEAEQDGKTDGFI